MRHYTVIGKMLEIEKSSPSYFSLQHGGKTDVCRIYFDNEEDYEATRDVCFPGRLVSVRAELKDSQLIFISLEVLGVRVWAVR